MMAAPQHRGRHPERKKDRAFHSCRSEGGKELTEQHVGLRFRGTFIDAYEVEDDRQCHQRAHSEPSGRVCWSEKFEFEQQYIESLGETSRPNWRNASPPRGTQPPPTQLDGSAPSRGQRDAHVSTQDARASTARASGSYNQVGHHADVQSAPVNPTAYPTAYPAQHQAWADFPVSPRNHEMERSQPVPAAAPYNAMAGTHQYGQYNTVPGRQTAEAPSRAAPAMPQHRSTYPGMASQRPMQGSPTNGLGYQPMDMQQAPMGVSAVPRQQLGQPRMYPQQRIPGLEAEGQAQSRQSGAMPGQSRQMCKPGYATEQRTPRRGPGSVGNAPSGRWDARSDAISDARSDVSLGYDQVNNGATPGFSEYQPEFQSRALREKMHQSAQQMSAGWGKQRTLSTALAAMEEIPKRVGECMYKVASHVVDRVQSNVASRKAIFRTHEASMNVNSDRVIGTLEMIPTMVHNLMEARIEKAKATVRHRVRGMMHSLNTTQEDGSDDPQKLVNQLRAITTEAEKLARETVLAAAQECRAHATRHLDAAMTGVQEPVRSQVMAAFCQLNDGDMMDFESAHVAWDKANDGSWLQHAVSELFNSAHGESPGTKQAFNQTMLPAQQGSYMPHSFTNEVVADELLRAKVLRNASGDANEPEQAENPGSIGHPNLCPRACIYFTVGKCANGRDCGFCHMPHPKRPVRLDKRHREALKRMPFGELVALMLPMLKAKALQLMKEAEAQGVESSLGGEGAAAAAGFLELLDALVPGAPQAPQGAEWPRPRPERPPSEGGRRSQAGSAANSDDGKAGVWKKDGLSGALEVMSLRSILTMLRRMSPAGAEREHALMDQILQKLQESSIPESKAASSVAASEDATSYSGSHFVARSRVSER
mmetsp:Transcript_99828/g.291260  ORF Transcript_99828/g.291260 Transcript_99828/m.291260 type:complete len:877 (+) Transcript_99828:58-2688(+)